MTVSDYFCIFAAAIALLNHFTYSLTAMGFVFKKAAPSTRHLNLLKVAFQGVGLSLFCLVWRSRAQLDQMQFIQALISLILVLKSTVLFWWTKRTNQSQPLTIAFSTDTPLHLVKNGPYAWVRHPFYVSYLLNFLGLVVLVLQPLSVGLFFIILAVYYQAATFEEKKFQNSSLAQEYAQYQKKVGLFFPKRGSCH